MPHPIPGSDDVLRVTLPNGITVLARENFTSPAVVLDGILWGGSLQDPPGKAGLSSFHSSLLMRGTKNYSFNALYEEIESIGASISVGSGGHSYSFDSKSLAEDLPLMLKLLSEILREPTFPEEHVELVRGQMLTNLQMREHDTRSMASLTFYELAYAGHPYAISGSGYIDTVSALTRDDLLSFQQNLGPRGAIIVVVGAMKAEDAIKRVEDAFGDWVNPQQPEAPSAPDAPMIDRLRQKEVSIPGKTQSDIVLGFVGPRRNAPDFQAARMANSILGVFGLYGRLGDVVRQQQGLAYYSLSRLAGGLGPGPWSVIAGVAPEKVEQAIESIRGEIRRIVEEAVTDEEIADNKSYFKGQLVLSLETNEGVSGSIMNMELYQLGLDYLRGYEQMIEAITVEDLRKAAAHYLNPDAYALAIAGPARS